MMGDRIEETVEAREVDGTGQMYLTIAELQAQEVARRAGIVPLLLPDYFPVKFRGDRCLMP